MEVEVAPLQAEQFAESQARVDGDEIERAPRLLGRLQQAGDLLGLEDVEAVLTVGARQRSVVWV